MIKKVDPKTPFEKWDQEKYHHELIAYLAENKIVVNEGTLIQAAKHVAWEAGRRSPLFNLEDLNLQENRFDHQSMKIPSIPNVTPMTNVPPPIPRTDFIPTEKDEVNYVEDFLLDLDFKIFTLKKKLKK